MYIYILPMGMLSFDLSLSLGLFAATVAVSHSAGGGSLVFLWATLVAVCASSLALPAAQAAGRGGRGGWVTGKLS
jgi:hypothetical protein